MSLKITDWLAGLGLEQYASAFQENAIDATVLPSLTAEDLKDLGVSLVGHRRRLLDAIASLRIAAQAAARTAPADAERRQLTVMLCDLVGSTALSERLDPEDLRNVIGAYRRCCSELVERNGGFVARFVGDSVLAYFGYPHAHELDAEHSVRAGLALVEMVPKLTTAAGVPLQVRVGIATGLVVVGDLISAGTAEEHAVVGDTPNLAARLQALAEPGTVVISSSTRRLTGGLFDYRDLEEVALKGFAEKVSAWQALGASTAESRFDALRGSAMTRLVGRDEEIDHLLRCWARAKTGNGQVVLISGEPGIGKSRIAAALEERLHAEPHLRLRYFCSPYHQDTALFPFSDQLARASGFARDDPPAAKLKKLVALLTRAAPPEEDVLFLADLLSLPTSEHRRPPNVSSQRKKERTLEALLRQLESLARRQPVLTVFEDAHWIDPTSRELLDLAVEQVRRLPVLLIATFRPEFQQPWTGRPQVSLLALNRLDRHDRTALIEQIAGGKALPDDVIDQIADRTDGVPLFIEELTKSVLESGVLRKEKDRYVLDAALPPFAIPTSLYDSLMERLDRLAAVRRVAQIGAAIGREFPYTLLLAVSRLTEDELQASLARLVASELVVQRGTPPDAGYAFKHALVQDAAHGSLLRTSRQQLHARIAKALETQSPELMDNQPELFAQHYGEAGLIEKSVIFWSKAGQRSVARSAMAEAAAQFQRGLDQLALLPQTPERQRQELEFWSALGAVLLAVKGYAALETGHAYARARQLWEQLGSPLEFLQVPYGQSVHHALRGELDRALHLDEDLLRLSGQRNDSGGLVLGHTSIGRNLMFAGRLRSSRLHLEEVLALSDSTVHPSLVHQAGIHPRVNAQAILGLVLFCLGFPDQALAHGSTAIAEARRLAHQPSLIVALGFGIRVSSLGGDDACLAEWVDQLAVVAADQGFRQWRAEGTIYRGWGKVKTGDVVEGISLLRGGASAFRATGAAAWMPYHGALSARAYEVATQIEEAVTQLDDALQTVGRTGERWLEAELNRHKGKLLLRLGYSEAAEELYRTALTIAEEQGAKLWELRAATGIAQLCRDQGRYAEARDLLAPVYAWFAEGFNITDLIEAKALLAELG